MQPLPQVVRFGTGRAARLAATARAEAMREQGIAARALFKLEFGGWVVSIHGRIRQKPPAREGQE
jgi:hypothetical protein